MASLRASSAKNENRPPAPSAQTAKTTKASSATSRPRKKQKKEAATASNTDSMPSKTTSFAGIKGRKGKLRFMTEMPMDTLFEIFSQLEPVDLLHLSRATKDLRNMLIAPKSAFLWERAYQNLSDPPPLCPGLNLRYFTNFLYGRHCYFCGSAHNNVFHQWSACVRLCRKCAPKQLMQYNKKGTTTTIEPVVLNLFPGYSNPGRYISKMPNLSTIPKIEYEHTLREFQAATGKEETERIRATKQRRYLLGKRISAWWDKRQGTLEQLRKKRNDEIVRRVDDEGYSKELRELTALSSLPGFKDKSAKELNNEDWKRIKPRLLRVLKYTRQQKIKEEIETTFISHINAFPRIVDKFYSKMPQPSAVPPIIHLARSPPFVDLIKDIDVARGPTLSDLIKDAFSQMQVSEFQDLMPYIPSIIASWKESADECLLALLPQRSISKSTAKGKGRATNSHLELATSFFNCCWCREPISYPRILMHHCVRDRRLVDDGDAEDDLDLELELEVEDDQRKLIDFVWDRASYWYAGDWNEGNHITFDEEASGFARVIVKVCGEDPDKVTSDQMKEIDARVECLRCIKAGKPVNRSRLVMNWTTAILHDIENHYQEPPNEHGWQLLGKDDTDKAKALESRKKSGSSKSRDFDLDRPMKWPPYAVRI